MKLVLKLKPKPTKPESESSGGHHSQGQPAAPTAVADWQSATPAAWSAPEPPVAFVKPLKKRKRPDGPAQPHLLSDQREFPESSGRHNPPTTHGNPYQSAAMGVAPAVHGGRGSNGLPHVAPALLAQHMVHGLGRPPPVTFESQPAAAPVGRQPIFKPRLHIKYVPIGLEGGGGEWRGPRPLPMEMAVALTLPLHAFPRVRSFKERFDRFSDGGVVHR
jgi:hypothetical protein